jgi:hypothetical protein
MACWDVPYGQLYGNWAQSLQSLRFQYHVDIGRSILTPSASSLTDPSCIRCKFNVLARSDKKMIFARNVRLLKLIWC